MITRRSTLEDKLDALENKELLNSLELDFTAFKLSRAWNSHSYIWSRWIRTA